MEKPKPQDYSAYITCIGGGRYQAFIKNISSSADFVRIIIGYTGIKNGERVGKIVRDWIISPLKVENPAVFIEEINKNELCGVRFWVAFQAMKRAKPKNAPIGIFAALSPMPSRWRRTIGSTTFFDIQSVNATNILDSVKKLSLV
jgi:hypothetical protein